MLVNNAGVFGARGRNDQERVLSIRSSHTDPDAARDFYVDAVGLDFAADESILAVWPLHEQARARAAPAHCLGHVGVIDLATTVRQLLDRGSQLLGRPLLRGEDGEAFAILRDPCEAVVAVRETSRRARREPVTWHQALAPQTGTIGAVQ